MPGPLVLAFDTATDAATCCLWRDGRTLAVRDGEPGARAAQALLVLVDGLIAEGGADRREIGLVAVGVGPGSYTGLRIGIAAATGLALGLEVRAAGVSTLAALLRGAGDGDAIALIDGGRGEVFVQGAGIPASAAMPGTLGKAVRGHVCVGSGARRYRALLEGAGAVVLSDDDPRHRVQAGQVAALAVTSATHAPPVALYLRRPDAREAA